MKNNIVCVVGASGSGKDTIVRHALESYPQLFRKFISVTTREPRSDEVNGEDYYFITNKEFQEKIDSNDFFLTAEFAGTNYGTLYSEIENNPHNQDKTLLMIVVEDTAHTIKQAYPNTIIVHINVSENIVKERMKSRGDSLSTINQRVEADRPRRKNLTRLSDYTINNNGSPKAAMQQLVNLIQS